MADSRSTSRSAIAPPPGFLAFVERNLDGLRRQTDELTGNPELADRLRIDLLSRVATRWQRFGRRGGEADRLSAAEEYLAEQFSRETGGSPAIDSLAEPGQRRAVRPGYDGDRPDSDAATLAARAWRRSRRGRQVRISVAAAAVAALALIAVLVRPAATGLVPVVPIPAGVVVAPAASAIPLLPTGTSALPAYVTIDPMRVVDRLSANPTPHALALFQLPSGGVYVLGADRAVRQWDLGGTAPIASGSGLLPAMSPSSLAPDGVHAVLRGDGTVRLADLSRGSAVAVKAFPDTSAIRWLDNDRVYLSSGIAAGVYDLTARTLTEQRFSSAIPVTDQGGDGDGVQLPAPGRIQSISSTGTAGPATDVTAPSWLGTWIAPAFRYGPTLVAGAAVQQGLVLPAELGEGVRAIAVVRDGRFAGALVATAEAGSPPPAALALLGWLDDRQVLVATGGGTNPAIVAWTVGTSTFTVLTRLSTDATVSLANQVVTG
jgi:hypothetical protein